MKKVKEDYDFAYIDTEVQSELLRRGFIEENELNGSFDTYRLQEIKQSIMDLYKKLQSSSMTANFTVTYEVED